MQKVSDEVYYYFDFFTIIVNHLCFQVGFTRTDMKRKLIAVSRQMLSKWTVKLPTFVCRKLTNIAESFIMLILIYIFIYALQVSTIIQKQCNEMATA